MFKELANMSHEIALEALNRINHISELGEKIRAAQAEREAIITNHFPGFSEGLYDEFSHITEITLSKEETKDLVALTAQLDILRQELGLNKEHFPKLGNMNFKYAMPHGWVKINLVY
jgi:hypothetical protein